MLQMFCSTRYNLFIMAKLLYVLWLTSLVCACIQDLMHVTFSELVMHSYHIMQDVLLISHSPLLFKGSHVYGLN